MTSQIPPRRQLRSRALQVLLPPLLLPLPLQRRPILRQMRPLQVMQQLLLLLLPPLQKPHSPLRLKRNPWQRKLRSLLLLLLMMASRL